MNCVPPESEILLSWFCIWLRGGIFAGGVVVADRTVDIFPLAITYTVQKSGAAFNTLLGMSVVLNLL